MDFMKLLKSLDDFLYEVVGWIVFYPITFLRATLHPVAMLRYSDRELAETEEEQYTDTIAPPIFLLLTLLIVSLVGKVLEPPTQIHVPAFLASDTNMLLFRGVAFSIFPVLMAVDLLRHKGQRIDRRTLRGPFYGQCFITAPFALAASIAGQLLEYKKGPLAVAGLTLYGAALLWYVAVEIIWFSAALNISKLRAVWNVLVVVVISNVIVAAAAIGLIRLAKAG